MVRFFTSDSIRSRSGGNFLRARQYLRQVKRFLLIAILGLAFPLPAQEHDLKFEHFSIEDGLSHNKVNCVFQDRRGFLWVGTNEGLNKFDGYEFTVFRWRPENPRGLSAQIIRAIVQDREGNLWIGTEGDGVNLLERHTESFRHFTSDSSSEIRISSQDVNAICEDGEGNLWLGTGSGLDHFDWRNRSARNYFPAQLANAGARAKIVNVVYADKHNNLWVGTQNSGLWFFNREQKSFVCYQHDARDPSSLGDNDVRSLHEDTQGNFWIGTTFGGLNLFDRANKTFRRFFAEQNDAEGATIRAIWDDERGNLWVGDRDGLHLFDRATQSFRDYRHDPNEPYSLSHNSVQCIFQDAKGDLWIGTRDGLNFLNTDQSGFKHYQAKARDRRFLNNKVVYALLEDRDGNLWFGTEEGGLNYLDVAKQEFTYYKHDNTDRASLSVNNIKALLEDRNGHLWIGTFQGGLNVLDRSTGRFTHYQSRANDPHSLAGNEVMALLQTREGEIWVGTLDNGLDVWEAKTRRFRHFFTEQKLAGYRSITALLETRDGKIWIGSNHGRLGCWNKAAGAFKPYQLPVNNIATIAIRALHEDEAGNLWIGTTGGGLFFFNHATESFKAFTLREGLPSNIIYGILEDEERRLWLSSANGLVQFEPRSGKIKTYFKENGLQSNQFCYNAFMQTRRGAMFFGGNNGVTAFYPAAIRDNAYVPPVVITRLNIFNQPVEIGGPENILRAPIGETEAITLSYRHSVFSFEFAALNYAARAQNQYAYKMEGFDHDWNRVGPRRLATYTNLNPGTYTFRVLAANNAGVWNEEGAALTVTITPPFWQSWWFKLLGLALSALIIKHLYDYQAQKRNALEAKSRANLSQLKLLRYQMNPHFLFNAHNSIRSMILIDKERAWQMITELSEFFRYTLLNFDKVEVSLEEEIKAVDNYLHIEKIRYRDSLEVRFEIDEAARKCSVPAFIFQPLVENAIKYGMNTSPMPLRVVVLISFTDGVLSLDVSNTGALRETETRSKQEAHGTSLVNLRQRLELMFKTQYAFQLYEESGWVHAKIRIDYDATKNGGRILPRWFMKPKAASTAPHSAGS